MVYRRCCIIAPSYHLKEGAINRGTVILALGIPTCLQTKKTALVATRPWRDIILLCIIPLRLSWTSVIPNTPGIACRVGTFPAQSEPSYGRTNEDCQCEESCCGFHIIFSFWICFLFVAKISMKSVGFLSLPRSTTTSRWFLSCSSQTLQFASLVEWQLSPLSRQALR